LETEFVVFSFLVMAFGLFTSVSCLSELVSWLGEGCLVSLPPWILAGLVSPGSMCCFFSALVCTCRFCCGLVMAQVV
jgi:hypothetical protein